MLPAKQVKAGREIQYTYAITLSPDEKKIYIALSVIANPQGSGELYTYDLSSGELTFVQQLPMGIYTSADVRDSENIYFSHFGGPDNLWSGHPNLFILHVPPQP
jgi:outer membrane protein assembly factor BamB